MNGWQLPTSAVIGGKNYGIFADFRNILKIFRVLQDEADPMFLRWYVACALFYDGQIPDEDLPQAVDFLSDFLRAGERDSKGAKLLDWDTDAPMIVADINKVAGQEVRALPFVHWWTFLSWFHAIGEGQLSTVVAIRDKLRRGKKLEGWERDFYRENKARIDMKRPYTRQELAQQEQLKKLLGD